MNNVQNEQHDEEIIMKKILDNVSNTANIIKENLRKVIKYGHDIKEKPDTTLAWCRLTKKIMNLHAIDDIEDLRYVPLNLRAMKARYIWRNKVFLDKEYGKKAYEVFGLDGKWPDYKEKKTALDKIKDFHQRLKDLAPEIGSLSYHMEGEAKEVVRAKINAEIKQIVLELNNSKVFEEHIKYNTIEQLPELDKLLLDKKISSYDLAQNAQSKFNNACKEADKASTEYFGARFDKEIERLGVLTPRNRNRVNDAEFYADLIKYSILAAAYFVEVLTLTVCAVHIAMFNNLQDYVCDLVIKALAEKTQFSFIIGPHTLSGGSVTGGRLSEVALGSNGNVMFYINGTSCDNPAHLVGNLADYDQNIAIQVYDILSKDGLGSTTNVTSEIGYITGLILVCIALAATWGIAFIPGARYAREKVVQEIFDETAMGSIIDKEDQVQVKIDQEFARKVLNLANECDELKKCTYGAGIV